MNRACYILWRLVQALGAAFSRFINAAFLNGSTHQSVSARAYAESFSDPKWAYRLGQIDGIFGDGHCEAAWNYEVDNALATLERNGLIKEAP